MAGNGRAQSRLRGSGDGETPVFTSSHSGSGPGSNELKTASYPVGKAIWIAED
jgi:hypothetical protein